MEYLGQSAQTNTAKTLSGGPSAPRDLSALQQHCEQLEREIVELRGASSALVQRLSPILRPAPPLPVKNGIEAANPVMSPMAEWLRTRVDDVRRCREELADAINRVEV